MVKVIAGLLAAFVIAAGGYFGLELYVQQRIASEVEAVFVAVRANGGKAAYGKVAFNLWDRAITVADIAAETAALPPVRIKIGSVTASGVNQPDAGRLTANRIDAANVEVSGTFGSQAGIRFSYQAPRVEVTEYSGPGGPLRQLQGFGAAEVSRFALEHLAAITAKSAVIPTVTAKMAPTAAGAAGAGDYTYSGVALRDIKDGRIAATTVERVTFTAAMTAAGKLEVLTGDVVNLAAYDFDAAATAVVLDPAHASDDKYYRVYRQMTAGAYTASFEHGLKMRVEGVIIDDVGVRPSKLQFPALMAIVEAAPPPATTPTPEQMRDLLGKVAGIYEGVRVGAAEVRGFSMETPQGPFSIAAIRLANLANGKIGEVSLDGLDAKAPQGPVKVGRFALKALDVANLMRASALFTPGRNPSPEQLVALLLLLEGTEVAGLVAPYKDSSKPVTIDTLNIAWGEFVGPIPTRARVTLKMAGPVDVSDPEPFRMLALAGMGSATVNVDLGAAWSEGTRSFALEPVTIEVGSVFTAAARVSLANVPRETFSLNPLQAVIMAAQIEAGPIELALRDTGGIELAIAQHARQQKISREAARRAMTDSIRDTAMKMASVNPDVMALAGALTRFIENPRGTLTIKLVPKGKVGMTELADALRSNPIAALARFQVEAVTGR